jgi:hypothetical protein
MPRSLHSTASTHQVYLRIYVRKYESSENAIAPLASRPAITIARHRSLIGRPPSSAGVAETMPERDGGNGETGCG